MRQAVHQDVVIILHLTRYAYTADAAEPLPETLCDLYVANIAMADLRGVTAEDAMAEDGSAGGDSKLRASAPHSPAKQHDTGESAWDGREHSEYLCIEAVDGGGYRRDRRAKDEYHIEEKNEWLISPHAGPEFADILFRPLGRPGLGWWLWYNDLGHGILPLQKYALRPSTKG
jgi:hypothetical protein